MYSTPSNIYGLLNEFVDGTEKDTVLKELNALFDREFGKGKLSIVRWDRIQNGIEIIHDSKGNPHWQHMRRANVVAAIYPDGRLGISDKSQVKLDKVVKILTEFAMQTKNNVKLKRLLLSNTEKSLNQIGIKSKNIQKQVKKPVGSFSTSFKIPDAVKAKKLQELKAKGRI